MLGQQLFSTKADPVLGFRGGGKQRRIQTWVLGGPNRQTEALLSVHCHKRDVKVGSFFCGKGGGQRPFGVAWPLDPPLV